MEKNIEVKKWKEGNPPVEFTLKKKTKSIFELDDKSREAYNPTLVDYFDNARTPAERKIFNELITRENRIVDRMMGARGREHASKKKIEKLRKQNKSLLPDVKRGEKVLLGAKQAGEMRSATYKQLYELYRIEAGHCKDGLSKSAIAHIVAIKVERDKQHELPINTFLDEHNLKPLTQQRIARII